MVRISDKTNTVFFDLGGTLGFSTHSPQEIWLAVSAQLGLQIQEQTLAQGMAEADSLYMPKVYEYRGRTEEFWHLYHAFVVGRLNLPKSGGDLLQAVDFAFLDTKRWMQPFPETHEVLSSLKRRGLHLGVISNNTDEMIDRMNDLDLVKYFDTLTYSQEAGAEKPAPEPFRLALERAERKPEQCLHVGNSIEEDVAGARGVGMEPVLVDREGGHPNPPCAVVKDLRELLDTS